MRIAFKVGLMGEEEASKALETIDLDSKVSMPIKKKSQTKSTGRLEITGNSWMRFAGRLFKRLNRIFGKRKK
jgi:hypothetical protein